MLLSLVVFLLLMLFIRVQLGIYYVLIRNTKFYVDTIVNIFLWEILLSIMLFGVLTNKHDIIIRCFTGV